MGSDDLLANLFSERLSRVEKMMRDMNHICDKYYLMYQISKYPLSSDRKNYKVIVGKVVDKKWKGIKKFEDMELEVVLKHTLKYLEEYDSNHKEYNLRRNGGDMYI